MFDSLSLQSFSEGGAAIPDTPGIGRLPDRNALASHLVYTSHP